MRILVVEDDQRTSELLCEALAARGHSTAAAAGGGEAVRLAYQADFDVVVLDRMLPDISGIDVIRELRLRGLSFPILMLTALGAVDDRVAGLEAGADDYLVKPFSIEELQARLCALQRRAPLEARSTRCGVDDLKIDLLSRKVQRGGRNIHLQPREFDLLVVLVRNAGRPVTRKMFLEQVWRIQFDPATNIVDSHISRLRAKLRQGFKDDPIQTIQGVGYQMRLGA
jgi:two-component system OmpR family response regulator